MDILQNLTNLLAQGVAAPQQQQYQQAGAGGMGGGLGGLSELLNPNMLSGLLGSLMGGRGGAMSSSMGARQAGGAGGMDLGSLIGGLMGGGGAGLLGSLLGGGGQPPPAPQAMAPAPVRETKRGENLLRALIYAAKADGRIDQQEEAGIKDQIQKIGFGADTQNLVNQFLAEPVDPRRIAQNITDPNEAVQIFALSVALTRVDQPAEQQYIAALGQALGIPPNAQQSVLKRVFG